MRNNLRLIIALLVLTALSGAAFAQAQQQLPNTPSQQIDPSVAFGPPSVAVTEVKIIGVSGNDLRVRVKWNAQIPSTTKVEKFKALLAVNYASGAPALPNLDTASSAREAIFLAPNRGVDNPPKSFGAFIQAFFTTILVQNTSFSRSFKLDKSNDFSDGKLAQGGIVVGKVSVANNGATFSKLDVFWAFTAPPQPFGTKEVKFEVSGAFVYRGANGNQQDTNNLSATLIAGAGVRQAQFSFPAKPKFTNGCVLVGIDANITVKAFFAITQRNQSAALEGNF